MSAQLSSYGYSTPSADFALDETLLFMACCNDHLLLRKTNTQAHGEVEELVFVWGGGIGERRERPAPKDN